MESSGGQAEYSQKKGIEDVPVDSCKGWFDSCEFCDKRFCEWMVADDEVLDKIPDKPGFFMAGLKNKNVTEVVDILYNDKNMQKPAYKAIDLLKQEVANKKSKMTKSAIMIRWMETKKSSDKEITTLCAHWVNTGVLPKFSKEWPGQSLLEKSDTLVFSNELQKWCHRQKNPVWRKPKPPSSKIVEVVKKCNWSEPCETCDSYFSEWKCLVDVLRDNLAPEKPGLFMICVHIGKKREVVYIGHHQKKIVISIRSELKGHSYWLQSFLKNSKFVNKNASLEVRWAIIEDVDSDNSCFLFGHFLNTQPMPMFSSSLPGLAALERNKNFVYRMDDNNWCYEIETLKPAKINKKKNKRDIMEEIENELAEI